MYRMYIDSTDHDLLKNVYQLVKEEPSVSYAAIVTLTREVSVGRRMWKIICREFPLDHTFNVGDVQAAFERADYEPSSSGSILTRLIREGSIERVKRGWYRRVK